MVEWSDHSSLMLKVPGSKHSLRARFLSVGNGYSTFFRTGEGEVSEEEWHPLI